MEMLIPIGKGCDSVGAPVDPSKKRGGIQIYRFCMKWDC